MIPLALFLATAIVHLPKAHAQSALSYLFVGAGGNGCGDSVLLQPDLSDETALGSAGGGNGTLNVQNDGTLVLG